jgi:hypothetical protein
VKWYRAKYLSNSVSPRLEFFFKTLSVEQLQPKVNMIPVHLEEIVHSLGVTFRPLILDCMQDCTMLKEYRCFRGQIFFKYCYDHLRTISLHLYELSSDGMGWMVNQLR